VFVLLLPVVDLLFIVFLATAGLLRTVLITYDSVWCFLFVKISLAKHSVVLYRLKMYTDTNKRRDYTFGVEFSVNVQV